MSRTHLTMAGMALLWAAMPCGAAAQKTIVRPGVTESTAAVIEKIDVANRFVLLRDGGGEEVGVFAPPEFGRLKELRVGDRLTITYYQSTVYRLQSARAPRPDVAEHVAATESTSAQPGATFSHQVTERVTVEKIDREAASNTVINSSGQSTTHHVDNPSDLDGVSKGDHVDITYTQAVLATVSRPNNH